MPVHPSIFPSVHPSIWVECSAQVQTDCNQTRPEYFYSPGSRASEAKWYFTVPSHSLSNCDQSFLSLSIHFCVIHLKHSVTFISDDLVLWQNSQYSIVWGCNRKCASVNIKQGCWHGCSPMQWEYRYVPSFPDQPPSLGEEGFWMTCEC